MKILVDFKDYQPWGGAVSKFNIIKENGKLEHFETYLDELYGEGPISAVELNDFISTDFDKICDDIGIEDPWGEFETTEVDLKESIKETQSCLNSLIKSINSALGE